MSGPLVIGPVSPVASTPFQFTCPAETVAIYIQNYSRFTLLLAFSPTKPTATDSLNNQFDGQIAAGGRDVFYVQSRGASASERGLNAMGAFAGSLWIMPVDRSGSLALNGTISGINDIWVSAYGPFDPPPPVTSGMPLGIDLTSQTRVIALPPPGDVLIATSWDPNVSMSLELAQIQLSTGNIAAGQMVLYTFHLSFFPSMPASLSSMAFFIEIQFQDATFTNVGSSQAIFRTRVSAGATASAMIFVPLVLTPAFPLASLLFPPNNAAWLNINAVWISGAKIAGDINFVFVTDLNNAGAPPGYGGGAGTGAQRWNGQYSTQAGIW